MMWMCGGQKVENVDVLLRLGGQNVDNVDVLWM